MAKQSINSLQYKPYKSGSTVCNTGAPTSVAALDSGGMYIVSVRYPADEANNPYSGVAIISAEGSTRSKIHLSNFGIAITITMSNLNVVVTQSSGITLTIPWSITRLM